MVGSGAGAVYFDTPPFSRENLHMLATFIGNVHPMLPAVHKQACNTQSDCSPVILVTNFPSSSLVCSPVMCIARSVFWLASTHVAQYRVKLSPGPRIEIEELLSFSLSCTSPTRDANLKILVVCLFILLSGSISGREPSHNYARTRVEKCAPGSVWPRPWLENP